MMFTYLMRPLLKSAQLVKTESYYHVNKGAMSSIKKDLDSSLMMILCVESHYFCRLATK